MRRPSEAAQGRGVKRLKTAAPLPGWISSAQQQARLLRLGGGAGGRGRPEPPPRP